MCYIKYKCKCLVKKQAREGKCSTHIFPQPHKNYNYRATIILNCLKYSLMEVLQLGIKKEVTLILLGDLETSNTRVPPTTQERDLSCRGAHTFGCKNQ